MHNSHLRRLESREEEIRAKGESNFLLADNWIGSLERVVNVQNKTRVSELSVASCCRLQTEEDSPTHIQRVNKRREWRFSQSVQSQLHVCDALV